MYRFFWGSVYKAKMEMMFVYLSNTSHFIYCQSVRSEKYTLIIRLMTTGGTSGQNLTRLRR